MRFVLFAGALALLASDASGAQQPVRETGFYTSLELKRVCAAPVGTSKKNECRTYIAAVVDGLWTGEPVYGRRACIPRETHIKTIMLVVELYQSERSGLDHQNAAKIVVAAVADKWPCHP
jgi:hypothetical protein